MLNKLLPKPIPASVWFNIKLSLELKQNKPTWFQSFCQKFEYKPVFYFFAPVVIFVLVLTINTVIISEENSKKEVNSYLVQILSHEYISTDFNDGTFLAID